MTNPIAEELKTLLKIGQDLEPNYFHLTQENLAFVGDGMSYIADYSRPCPLAAESLAIVLGIVIELTQLRGWQFSLIQAGKGYAVIVEGNIQTHKEPAIAALHAYLKAVSLCAPVESR